MLCPLPPASPFIPAPQATAQYNALRPPQAALPASIRFGNAKAPISANPFVWLFNGIKSSYDWFSKTKVGQWVNRFFSKINQFLKAKPKDSPQPASPAPSPTPASTPTKSEPTDEPAAAAPPQAAGNPPAVEAPPPPEASSPPPPAAAPPKSPQPPVTEPVASKPQFVPYSERSLEALQKKQAKFQKLQTAYTSEQAMLQNKLEYLKNQRAEQQTKLKQAQRLWSEEEEEFLIPDLIKGISILDAEIKTLTQNIRAIQSKLDFIQQRTPHLNYWIQFRQKLQAAQ